MVKISTMEGIKKSELRFYKNYRSAKRFWNQLPIKKRISFSDFRKTDLWFNGVKFNAIINYYPP